MGMVETMQNDEREYNATKFTTKTLTTNLNVKENVIIELKKKIQNETETWNTTQTELEQQNVHMSTAIGELETRLYAAMDEIRNTTLTINTKQTELNSIREILLLKELQQQHSEE